MIGGLEGVAVLVAADVDAGAWVAVLPPRAARTGVLVHDGEGQAGLLQADAGEDPCHSAPDDQDRRIRLDLFRDLAAPSDGAGVTAFELQIIEEQPGERTAHRAAPEERHHLEEQGRGQLVRHAATVPVGRDGRQSPATDLGPLLGGHPTLDVQRHRHPRPDITTDPRRVAGHVHERAQKGRDAAVLEGRSDRRVGIGEGLTGVWVPGHRPRI